MKYDTEKLASEKAEKPSKRKADDILASGFSSGALHDVTSDIYQQRELQSFLETIARDLAPDDYDPTGTRFRSKATLLMDVATRGWLSVDRKRDEFGNMLCSYVQSAKFNSEVNANDSVRWFRAMAEEHVSDPRLHQLIGFALELAIEAKIIARDAMVKCNIHVVEQRASASKIAYTSPSVLHVDGEPFTLIMLAKRDYHVVDGKNFVAERNLADQDPNELNGVGILAETTLLSAGQYIAVDDAKVSHHVNGISSANGARASRATILIDFSPLEQQLTINQ